MATLPAWPSLVSARRSTTPRSSEGLGACPDIQLRTYEPEYNAVHQVVLDDRSPLYSFEPDFVVFLTAVQAFRNVLLATDITDRVAVAKREMDELDRSVETDGADPRCDRHRLRVRDPVRARLGKLQLRKSTAHCQRVVRQANDRLRALAAEVPNVYTIDTDHLASWNGKQRWFDERLWFYSKSSCHPEVLPQVAGEAVDIFRAVKGKSLKCVALDLDNVLWGGVIGDDGLNGIRLGDLGEGEAFVQFQLWLTRASCARTDARRV